MKLSELLKAIQPVQIIGSTEKDITGVNIDSRLVAAGHLFMAMRGTQTDGHAYIPTAIEKGAIAVLCEDMPEETNPDVMKNQKVLRASRAPSTLLLSHPSCRRHHRGSLGSAGLLTAVNRLAD